MGERKKEGGDWKERTTEDLKKAQADLESLGPSISGALSREQARTLWLSYLLVEKSVAFVKIELEDENPGRFIEPKRYTVPDERQAVAFSAGHLREAILRFNAGDLAASLIELRESRNYLRVLLKRVRRQRLKGVSKA